MHANKLRNKHFLRSNLLSLIKTTLHSSTISSSRMTCTEFRHLTLHHRKSRLKQKVVAPRSAFRPLSKSSLMRRLLRKTRMKMMNHVCGLLRKMKANHSHPIKEVHLSITMALNRPKTLSKSVNYNISSAALTPTTRMRMMPTEMLMTTTVVTTCSDWMISIATTNVLVSLIALRIIQNTISVEPML